MHLQGSSLTTTEATLLKLHYLLTTAPSSQPGSNANQGTFNHEPTQKYSIAYPIKCTCVLLTSPRTVDPNPRDTTLFRVIQ